MNEYNFTKMINLATDITYMEYKRETLMAGSQPMSYEYTFEYNIACFSDIEQVNIDVDIVDLTGETFFSKNFCNRGLNPILTQDYLDELVKDVSDLESNFEESRLRKRVERCIEYLRKKEHNYKVMEQELFDQRREILSIKYKLKKDDEEICYFCSDIDKSNKMCYNSEMDCYYHVNCKDEYFSTDGVNDPEYEFFK